jgi:predicted short-subunit dehydrogenase-like oxidoreductase (DUF2520 family)
LDHEVTETMTATGGSEPRLTIALIGAGRAGSALIVALHEAGYRIVAIHSHGYQRAAELAGRVGARAVDTPLAATTAADLSLVAVPDAAITLVAAAIASTGASLWKRAVVHCSASRGAEALAALRIAGARVGALHPLQALTGAASAGRLRDSVMTVEADPGLELTLDRLVQDLGAIPMTLPPGSRRLYHAAAVLAGNAPLALLAAAVDLLVSAGVDRVTAERGLASLLAGAAANAQRLGARAALTGPVVRGDTATVAGHLQALQEHPAVEALYRSLAAETLRLAGLDGREAIAALLSEPAQRRSSAGRRAVA